jgi:hypothetical protein
MQDVIKMTFTALHDVIKAQGSAIKSLEREVKTKVSAADMEGALMHKANIVDVNSSLQDVSTGSTHVCHLGGVLIFSGSVLSRSVLSPAHPVLRDGKGCSVPRHVVVEAVPQKRRHQVPRPMFLRRGAT